MSGTTFLRMQDCRGRTPLYYAVVQSCFVIVKILIKLDPTTIAIPDTEGHFPVFGITCTRLFKYLLRSYTRYIIGQKNPPKNENVLHSACLLHSVQCVDMLLELCPTLLHEVTTENESPLQVAFRSAKTKHVNAILRFKPDLKDTDKNGNTVLHMAVTAADMTVIRPVFEHCVSNLYCYNVQHKTPFCLAVEAKNGIAVQLFQK